MTLANDSVTLPAASGTIASHTAAGKEHQVMMLAAESGQIFGSEDTYIAYFPQGAVGANKVHVDLWNATGSGKVLRVISAKAFPAVDVAVTGTLGVQLALTRTTAIGTGGTANAVEGTTLTAPNISRMDPGAGALPAQITARLAPTAGATAGAFLTIRSVFTEETAAPTGIAATIGAELVGRDFREIVVPENSGVRIVQGAVASVGSLAFEIVFTLV